MNSFFEKNELFVLSMWKLTLGYDIVYGTKKLTLLSTIKTLNELHL
jgi:hypothetical protein